LPVAPTLLARGARPSSLKGGPKQESVPVEVGPLEASVPLSSDQSRLVSDSFGLLVTRQRRILVVLSKKEAPLCVLIS
jgi:hypothetical protein